METLYLLAQLLKGVVVFLLFFFIFLYPIAMAEPAFGFLAFPLAIYATYMVLSGKAREI